MAQNDDTKGTRLDVPQHLRYSQDHVWVDDSVSPAILGITDYAASQMGDIVFVDLPVVDTHVEAGDELLQVESAKAVEPVISPVAGTVRYVNREAEDDGAIVNDDPYGEGWLVKIDLDDENPDLMDADEYAAMIG
ncbi:glycine cleavage system protein GcvH [Bifidobacterium cuniculi]|uniref:Glycine cleavage system H protein n=1 Tax=Bifidobacterium cuniculi TaxID=1688 RepID=A0A087ARP7_9BIFI|nr:glycine cleavage system protein GcvH [Bifidobacterium cuniculi]KFI61447.1 glycine cleavage system H protein [Bifidobacterium cuniculi]